MSDQESITVSCYGAMRATSSEVKVGMVEGNRLHITIGHLSLFITADDWDKISETVNDVLYPVVTHRIRFDDAAGTATVVSE